MRWLASSPYSFSKYTLSNSTSQTHTVKANWFGSWSVGRMDRWEDGQTDESCALMMCAFRTTAQPTTVSEEACPTELLARWPRQARFSDVSIGDVVLFYPALPFFMSTVRSLVQCLLFTPHSSATLTGQSRTTIAVAAVSDMSKGCDFYL